jgi:hypothetical protein
MPIPPMPMGLPGGGSPGGAPGGPPGGAAKLPGSPVGGPGGPGGSPMVSPGGGAGSKASAMATIKAVMRSLQLTMQNFEPGSKEFQGLMRALSALNPLFGQATGADLGPAAIRQMAATQQPGGPLAGGPPPGVASPPMSAPPPSPGGEM